MARTAGVAAALLLVLLLVCDLRTQVGGVGPQSVLIQAVPPSVEPADAAVRVLGAGNLSAAAPPGGAAAAVAAAAAAPAMAEAEAAIHAAASAAAAGASSAAGQNATEGAPPEYFITIGPDGNFRDGCRTFFPAGWNQYEVVEAAAGAPRLYGASLPPNKTGPQLIRDIMDMAVTDQLSVLRTFAFATDAPYALQTSPGVFHEDVFRGLDYVLDQARQRGLKVILALINNWESTGSVDETVGWANLTVHEDFFSDPVPMQIYKNSVKAVVTRLNTINGRMYRDDPTIMAWNLINEPRCFNCINGELHAWLMEMAAYVKDLDSNHLLSPGAEGFYAGDGPNASQNPSTPQGTLVGWPGIEGQDFPTDLRIPHLDYGTVHSWVDNWFDTAESFQMSWVHTHIAAATTAKSSIMLEEFGKFPANRDQFFGAIYDAVLTSASTGGPLKGVAFWQWYDDGQVASAAEGGGAGDFGIRQSDSTFALIRQNAAAMRNLSAPILGCTAAPARVPLANNCTATWVAGRPGTGYEGPTCSIDINECVRGTSGCASNAGCINSAGSYHCKCFFGYSGDGQPNCTASAALPGILAQYTTTGPGQVACSQGTDVAYSAGAPGFAYDPTGSSNLSRGYGNVLPVSVEGCQLACEAAIGCDSVSYNAATQLCFLKTSPSTDTCQATQVICGQPGQDSSCSQWQTYRKALAQGPPGFSEFAAG